MTSTQGFGPLTCQTCRDFKEAFEKSIRAADANAKDKITTCLQFLTKKWAQGNQAHMQPFRLLILNWRDAGWR